MNTLQYFKQKIYSALKIPIPFNELPKSKQVVLIAKDVIEQINCNKYKPYLGLYITSMKLNRVNETTGVILLDEENLDIQANFDNIKQCEVCALGACLMSATKFKNKLTFGDIGSMGNPKVKEMFLDIFSKEQLLLIEHAYEGYNPSSGRIAHRQFGLDNHLPYADIDKIYKLHAKFPLKEDRLIAIMNNIIDNKGTFKL